MKPRQARADLRPVRLVVDTALPAPIGLPLEVLDGIRDVDVVPVDAGLVKRGIEQPAGRPDEGTAFPVLVVTGLLADQHDPSARRPLTEHGLGRALPEVARTTAGSALPDRFERAVSGADPSRCAGAGQ